MSAAFKVGEVAILQNAARIENNGRECTVVRGLQTYKLIVENCLHVHGYEVQCADGSVFVARPDQLRKKQPPRSYKSKYRQAMLDCIAKAKQPMKVGA